MKQKYITSLFRSVYRKFSTVNKLSTRLLKKFCSALHTRNLVDRDWLHKPNITVDVNYANKAPILQICLNNCSTNAILDTRSTFSLIPYTISQTLGLKKNQLDQSIRFNINSASHSNPDAVLGQIFLTITVKSKYDVEQVLSQNCLILRPHLDRWTNFFTPIVTQTLKKSLLSYKIVRFRSINTTNKILAFIQCNQFLLKI